MSRSRTLAVMVLALVALPAAAITYGRNDGRKHPDVGAPGGEFARADAR